MPTYSYRCTECGNAFDIKQSFSDATLTECPACGGVLRKVFSPVGVTFNGGGFYRTDSRAAPKGSSESSGSSGSSGSSESSSSTPAKTESKPAAAKPAASTTPKPAGS
ncbi:FmdB family zinc ribbon protein [Curtobacterium sp. NPDC087082]|uniref:FmdB family zinc ribbon protein n=1 Tax=unclassified Curtobacterium TaxID=257496 RepID=UPI00089DE366|nr:FmdB family zinc ribbon protein [Curtobacterium sp. BH-2-1-1]AOX66153.1 FmdB family transcriptional regulator [Curtobacterium sp. BH-2-1-1]